jgi:hypothetical protein
MLLPIAVYVPMGRAPCAAPGAPIDVDLTAIATGLHNFRSLPSPPASPSSATCRIEFPGDYWGQPSGGLSCQCRPPRTDFLSESSASRHVRGGRKTCPPFLILAAAPARAQTPRREVQVIRIRHAPERARGNHCILDGRRHRIRLATKSHGGRCRDLEGDRPLPTGRSKCFMYGRSNYATLWEDEWYPDLMREELCLAPKPTPSVTSRRALTTCEAC